MEWVGNSSVCKIAPAFGAGCATLVPLPAPVPSLKKKRVCPTGYLKWESFRSAWMRRLHQLRIPFLNVSEGAWEGLILIWGSFFGVDFTVREQKRPFVNFFWKLSTCACTLHWIKIIVFLKFYCCFYVYYIIKRLITQHEKHFIIHSYSGFGY